MQQWWSKKVASLSSVNVCNNCGKYNENYYIWTVVFSRSMPPVDIIVRLQCKIIGYMSCIYGQSSKVSQCKNTPWGRRRTNNTHTVILLPWLAQIEQITYSRSKNQLWFFLVSGMLVSRAALSVGDICKWIYASHIKPSFLLLAFVWFFSHSLFVSFLLGNPAALQRFQ